MWLCNRRFFALAAIATLAGCGFQPVHGVDTRAHALRGAVLIQAPSNRGEFQFVSILEDHLGRAPRQTYTLTYTLSQSSESVVASPSQGERRFNVVGTLSFDLKDQDGVSVTKGKVQAFTSYSATGSSLATNRARQDAGKRLMTILAENTLQRLNTHTQDAE